MRNNILLAVLGIFALPLMAQRQELSLYAIGNFNPTYYVGIAQPGPVQIVGDSADTMGGSAEYSYCWQDRYCLGPMFEANKTDGVLWAPNGQGGGVDYRWPLMRYEFAALGTEEFRVKHEWTPYITEGIGFTVTDSLVLNSGWSENFMLVSGVGLKRELTKHLNLDAGELLENTKAGCYDDTATPGPTYCASRRSLVQDPHVGLGFRW